MRTDWVLPSPPRVRGTHPYLVAPNSLSVSQWSGDVTAKLHGGPFGVSLNLQLIAYTCGVVRMRIVETAPLHGPRWEPQDILESSMKTAPLRLMDAAALGTSHALHGAVSASEATAYAFTTEGTSEAIIAIYHQPFKAQLYVGDAAAVTINPAGKFYFEHHRKRDDNSEPIAAPTDDVHNGKTVVDYGEDGLAVYSDGTKQEAKSGRFAKQSEGGEEAPVVEHGKGDDLWEESFGSHRDSKPYGPSSVGMDITFEGSSHIYGLAEHAAPLNLPSTVGGDARYKEPYRMYTLDVYDYELDSPMALYGGVPLVYSHSAAHTVGVLWFNPSETFVDISRTSSSFFSRVDSPSTHAYFMSESGVVDMMLIPGPTPTKAFGQYAALTGTTPLPPKFALGYHQCRWNYNDEDDVRYVHGQFEKLDIPYDVLWLDIEHTDGKRYFTWDDFKFPKPVEMQQELAKTGRKMVTIVDPHIKKGLQLRRVPGGTREEAVHPEVRRRGARRLVLARLVGIPRFHVEGGARLVGGALFAYDKYVGSTETLYTWNDMNEPSVFNGPEVSMDKDAKSLAGVEHREWHNLYGMYMQQATAQGLLTRNPKQDKRPFVLSRAFYAGSQRWGAIWTGDNACKWDHLEAAMPMLLSLGVCGITFSGADVGGFLGKGGGYPDPDAELFTRWFQAGAYQPFFRGHAHHDSARREPWTFDDATTQRLRAIGAQRYQLLSYWYTTFFISEATGIPTMRPLWVAHPSDARTWDMDKQFMAGGDLMVAPVYKQGATSVAVYFPTLGAELAAPWYDVFTGKTHAAGTDATIDAPIEKIPVFQRGGSIVPRQMRLRRSSSQMTHDPYTLTVARATQRAPPLAASILTRATASTTAAARTPTASTRTPTAR